MTDPSTPRPVPALPVERALAELLAGRAQAIAKGWLLTLLERTPLDAVGGLPAAALAAEGPSVCAAFARALGSDPELDRLRPGGELASLARRIGPLAGAPDAAATLAAVEALRSCVWAAALDARGERTDALAPLAERVAAVAAVLAATAVADAAVAPIAASPRDAAPASSAPDLPPAGAPAVRDLREGGEHGSPGSVTELPPRPAAGPSAAMDDGELWIATLERHLDRAEREGGGLALLRVELVDGERLVASAAPDERGVPYGRLAQAIRRAIRRQDLVASDRQGRAWVIAPAVGRAGAVALAERIGEGVEHGEQFHGAPLAATIGFAVYGEDGRDAATLIERAEEAMLAASAAGVSIGESIPLDDGDEDRPGPRLVR